jgi:hypothetical protein
MTAVLLSGTNRYRHGVRMDPAVLPNSVDDRRNGSKVTRCLRRGGVAGRYIYKVRVRTRSLAYACQ